MEDGNKEEGKNEVFLPVHFVTKRKNWFPYNLRESQKESSLGIKYFNMKRENYAQSIAEFSL